MFTNDDSAKRRVLELERALAASETARLEAEKRALDLAMREERLQLALGAAKMGTWDWDLTGGGLLLELRACDVFGFTGPVRTQLDSALAPVHPDDRERVRREIEQAIASCGRYRTEARVVTPEGDVRWVAAQGRVFARDEDGPPVPERFVGIIREITRRKRMEEDLRNSEHQLRVALEGGRLGTWSYDPGSDRWTWSLATQALFGFAADEEPSAQVAFARIHPEDIARVSDLLRRSYHIGEHYDVEYRIVLPGGNVRWVASYGQVLLADGGPGVKIAGVLQDITVSKRFEDRLRDSETRLRLATDAAGVGVWTWDLESRTLDADSRTRALYGLDPDVVVTCEVFFAVVHPDDRERVREAAMAAVANDSDYDAQYRTVWRDRSVHWVWARGRGTLVEDGKVTRMRGTVLDITDRKASEAEREALLNAVQEAGRRKDAFLAVLSHELRNPLAPIRNSLFILKRAGATPEQVDAAHAIIERQVNQLNRLVDDLLDVTRISRGKIRLERRQLEVNDLVRRAVEDQRLLFDNRDLQVEVSGSERPLWVYGDRGRLEQVIGNVLQNAAKFTDAGGRVSITVREKPNRVAIEIVDTGVGIPPEMLDRLFEPFVQASCTRERSGSGMGLGLSLSKGLVELHRGTIEATSEGVGRGTRVLIQLPQTGAPGRSRGGSQGQPHQRCRVLIIEDDHDAADTLRGALELLGHHVYTAYTGTAGLAVVRQVVPDVVLCDLDLPGIDGYELARRMREDARLARTRLIALSGHAQPEDERHAAESGFDLHLPKPPDMEQLEQVLSTSPRAA